MDTPTPAPADRAALRLAGLGRPVKKMVGGVTGGRGEGSSLVTGDDSPTGDAREVAP